MFLDVLYEVNENHEMIISKPEIIVNIFKGANLLNIDFNKIVAFWSYVLTHKIYH